MVKKEIRHILVAVGSPQHLVCSVGSFARQEATALKKSFESVSLVEPSADWQYPVPQQGISPDLILFHAPSLHDRRKPWNALRNAMILRRQFRKALFVPIVHEFSEAPLHWKLRQIALLQMSHGAVVNSLADFEGIKPWKKKLLRSRLGPTLFDADLMQSLSKEKLESKRKKIRTELSVLHQLDLKTKWVLHPGLVTPGKGVNFLEKLVPALGSDHALIVMGGFGPKQEDFDFAQNTLQGLWKKLGNRFTFVQSPNDETFKKVLLASDLTVLPYDNGLSERRSSFLSAMSTGANVWTTVGKFSAPMELEKSGAKTFDLQRWLSYPNEASSSIQAVLEAPIENEITDRVKNLEWARRFSWENRIGALKEFFHTLG